MRRLVAVTVPALSIASLFSACADSKESEAPREDAAVTAPPAPPTDAGPDVATEAASDASLDRVCTDDRWCHTDVPAEHMLVDVWGDGQGIVWAISELGAGTEDERGSILRWDGKSWGVHSPSKTKLAAIWGSGPNDLWAGGIAGLLHGDGTAWTTADLGEADIEVADIGGSSTSGTWVVGRSATAESAPARAFRRAPGSAVWERVQIEPLDGHPQVDGFSLRNVWLGGNGDVFVVGRANRDHLFRLRAGTSTWELVPFPSEISTQAFFQFSGAGSAGADVWLFGYRRSFGATYWVGKSSNLDESTDWTIGRWRSSLDGEEDKIRRFAVWGTSENDVWTCGAFARIQHWDGTTWTTARLSLDGVPIGDELRAFWGRSNDDLWAVGGRSALHRVSKEEAARLDAEHSRKDGGT